MVATRKIPSTRRRRSSSSTTRSASQTRHFPGICIFCFFVFVFVIFVFVFLYHRQLWVGVKRGVPQGGGGSPDCRAFQRGDEEVQSSSVDRCPPCHLCHRCHCCPHWHCCPHCHRFHRCPHWHCCLIVIIVIIVIVAIVVIIVTRPKPAYGRQGLVGSWGQDTDEVSTIWCS